MDLRSRPLGQAKHWADARLNHRATFVTTDVTSLLLTNVTEFQAQAKELLEPQGDKAETIPELELLQKCLERGASYGIDLPEIGRLKQVNFSFFSISFVVKRRSSAL